MAMYRAKRTWGSPDKVEAPPEDVGAWCAGSGEEVGFRREADRNMSCQGGVDALELSFGSEYGTNSMNTTQRERGDDF